MSKDKSKKVKKCGTYIGGQAVMEGVMMQGKTCMACAVRDQSGNIQIEAKRLNPSPALKKVSKIPFVRGTVNMVLSLVRGTKVLMRSAEVYGEDEEEGGKVSGWLAEKMKISVMDIVAGISVLLGVVLAVLLFVLLPRWLANIIIKDSGSVWYYVVWGGLKFAIFIAYLGIILFLKDIRRLYKYHGAEHKTINAYEHGMELTPESVKKASRIHDRCGTSFLFIVMLINVLIISLVLWAVGISNETIPNGALRFLAQLGIELVLLPVLAGVSYEILKFLAKFDNWFVTIFKSPGMLLQKALTTREPEEEMIEVAIAAFKKVLEMDADPTVPETSFVTGGVLSKMLKETKRQFEKAEIDESDAEWIYSIALGIKRSELAKERAVKPSESKRINELVEQRLTGKPLWYIIGDTEFYGLQIKVDERVLIPRPETEILAETVIKSVEQGDKVLDMCTGSGCIAIAVAKNCADRDVQVTASDISDGAIMLAKENAALNKVKVNFVVGDLFRNVKGKFNIIVCNPPYIKSGEIPEIQREVREFEPRVALDGGEDGLDFYRRIADEIKPHMAKDGMLIMECGEGQTEEILALFKKREYAMVIKDLAGVDRFVKIVF